MPIDNLSKITSRTGISTTILLEAGNVNATGIITAAGFNGPFTGGGAIAAGIITGTGLEISGISTFNDEIVVSSANPTIVFDQTSGSFSDNQYRIRGGSGKLSLQVSANNGASYTQAVSIGGIGNIFIPDDDKVFFGTNNDAYIQHDNSNLNVVNTTGNIDVTGNVVLNNDLKVGTGVTVLTDGNVSIGGTLDLSMSQVGFDNPSQIKLSDLVIGQHQNTGSYKIENGSTGSLLLRADMINFATSNGGTSLLRSSTSEVQIFSGNTNHFTVNGVGATVFGELDVTGDVGIGTTNPHKRLHVADYGTHGAIRVEGSGNGNRSGIEFYRETSAGVSKGGAAIWVESDTSTSAGKLRFGTASNAAIQSQNTDMILDDQGRLGIGTTNPQQKLQVMGTVVKTRSDSAVGLIYLTNDGSQNGNVLINDSSGVTRIKLDSSDVSYIRGGNLGIGSMTPKTELDVRGDIIFQNNMLISNMDSNGVGGSNIDHIWHSDALTPHAGGTWNFVSDGTAKQVGNSVIQAGYLKTSSGGSLLGKVGIGTTDPGGNLTVAADSASAIIELKRTNSNGGTGAYGAVNWTALDGHSVASIFALGDGDNEGAHLIFKNTSASASNDPYNAATVERLRIASNGRVGIGTNDPASNLNLFAAVPSDTSGILVQNVLYAAKQDKPYLTVGTHGWTGADTNWNTYGFQHKIKANNQGVPRVTIDSSGGTQREKFCVDNGGKVGIGTTDPDARLHVYGANEEDCILILESDKDNANDENDNPYIVFRQDGGIDMATVGMNPYGLDAENNALVLANSVVNNGGIIFKTGTTNGYTNATEALRIHDNGKVGIGTNVADGNLTIHADAANQTALVIHADMGTNNNRTLNIKTPVTDDGSEPFVIHTANALAVQIDSTERFRIKSNGLVGIGTTDPQVGLNVFNPTTLGGTTGNRQDIARFEGHVANDGILEFANVRLASGADWQTTSFRIQRRIDSTRMGYIDFGTGSGSGAGGAGRDIRFGSGEGRIMLQLDSTGSVGIGTKAPAVRLDVRNDSGTNADTEPLVALHHSIHGVDGEVLRIGRSDLPTIRYHKLHSQHSGTAANNTLKFYMHSGSAGGSATATRQVLTLQGNGRVGVGTTNGGLDAAFEVTSDEGAFIKSFTNAEPARVRFSDNASSGSYAQQMTIDYRHSDNQVVTGANEGLHIYGTEAISAVRIDGVLRVPEQPCAVVYQARGPAGNNAVTGSGDNDEPIHFDHVHINQGGMAIANDNARITVPVSGNYLVSGMISGTVTNIDTNDGVELIFLVDGSEYPATNSGIEPVFNFGHGHALDSNDDLITAAHSEYFASNTTILTLSENDYVELAVDNVSGVDASVNRGHLSVALLN